MSGPLCIFTVAKTSMTIDTENRQYNVHSLNILYEKEGLHNTFSTSASFLWLFWSLGSSEVGIYFVVTGHLHHALCRFTTVGDRSKSVHRHNEPMSLVKGTFFIRVP